MSFFGRTSDKSPEREIVVSAQVSKYVIVPAASEEDALELVSAALDGGVIMLGDPEDFDPESVYFEDLTAADEMSDEELLEDTEELVDSLKSIAARKEELAESVKHDIPSGKWVVQASYPVEKRTMVKAACTEDALSAAEELYRTGALNLTVDDIAELADDEDIEGEGCVELDAVRLEVAREYFGVSEEDCYPLSPISEIEVDGDWVLYHGLTYIYLADEKTGGWPFPFFGRAEVERLCQDAVNKLVAPLAIHMNDVEGTAVLCVDIDDRQALRETAGYLLENGALDHALDAGEDVPLFTFDPEAGTSEWLSDYVDFETRTMR